MGVNRETRDKFASGTQSDITSGNACWETPPLVFAALHEEFLFEVDLTADSQRALCPIWLGPGSQHGLHAHDALQAPWTAYGYRGYSNPPYGPFVQHMLAKAKREAVNGFVSALLLPMRATKAFHAHVLVGASELRFCDTRITFFENGLPRLNVTNWAKGKVTADPAMFDSIVVVYDNSQRRTHPIVKPWKVPHHVTKADLERAADARRKLEAA